MSRDVWTPSRWTARAVLMSLLVLTGWALLAPVHSTASHHDEGDTDVALYRAIVERMDRGSSYYDAVGVEQVERGYPTSPAPAVREPTVAWIVSTVGDSAAYVLLIGLAVLAAGVTIRRLDRDAPSRAEWIVGSVMVSLSVAAWCVPSNAYVHDVWAGLLVLTALMLHGQDRWRLSLALLTAAAIVRELAAPMLLIAAAVAWRRGRRTEALGWCAGVMMFGAFYAWHFYETRGLPDGSAGPGWLGAGGWPFSVEAVRFSGLLQLGPSWLAALVVPCALLGWTALGRRTELTVAIPIAFLAALMVVGRPVNAYWGALVAPLLLAGLTLAPRALIAWIVAACGREAGSTATSIQTPRRDK